MASLHQILISGAGNVSHSYGTCAVGDTWGIVRSCTVDDEADVQLFEDCRGNVREVLLTNETLKLNIDVEYDPALGKPNRGDDFAFPEPYADVNGQVINTHIKFERKDKVIMTLEVSHWKSMGNTPTVTELDDAE